MLNTFVLKRNLSRPTSGESLCFFNYYCCRMDVLKVTITILLMIEICESALRCVTEDCKRKKKDPPIKICKVEDLPEDSKIVQVKSLEYDRRNKCALDQTYGFRTDSIWVAGRCGGDFEVCFRRDSDDDLTTHAQLSTTTTSTRTKRSTVKVLFTKKPGTTVKTTFSLSIGTTPMTTPNVSSNNSTSKQDTKRRRELEGIAGILGGVVGGLVFMVLFVTVVVVIVKRSPCYLNKYRKHFSESMDNHKRVSTTISMETTMNDDTYDTLDMRRDSHSYQTCKSALSDPVHMYMTVYDSADGSMSDFSGNSHKRSCSKDSKSAHKKNDSNDMTGMPKRSETSALRTNFGQYGILDPIETGFYKGFPMSNNNKTRPVPPVPSNNRINISYEPDKTRLEHDFTIRQQANPTSKNGQVLTVNGVYHIAKPLPDSDNAPGEIQKTISDNVENMCPETKSENDFLRRQEMCANNYSHMGDFTYVSVQHNGIHKERQDNYDHIKGISLS